MTYDIEAIIKAYPETVVTVDGDEGAFDKNGNKISLEQSKIDAARVILNAEYAAIKYKDDRARAYPNLESQLDYIYHNGLDKWKTDIVDPVKAKYPKP